MFQGSFGLVKLAYNEEDDKHYVSISPYSFYIYFSIFLLFFFFLIPWVVSEILFSRQEPIGDIVKDNITTFVNVISPYRTPTPALFLRITQNQSLYSCTLLCLLYQVHRLVEFFFSKKDDCLIKQIRLFLEMWFGRNNRQHAMRVYFFGVIPSEKLKIEIEKCIADDELYNAVRKPKGIPLYLSCTRK